MFVIVSRTDVSNNFVAAGLDIINYLGCRCLSNSSILFFFEQA